MGRPGEAPFYLLPEEFSLPMAFKANADLGYATAAIGKWHLAGELSQEEQAAFHSLSERIRTLRTSGR